MNGSPINCATETCSFSTSMAITPVINSVSPNSVSDLSLITLNGNNFGNNITNLNVKIGTETCQVNTVNDTQVTCYLNGLNLGDQEIALNLKGKNKLKGIIFHEQK